VDGMKKVLLGGGVTLVNLNAFSGTEVGKSLGKGKREQYYGRRKRI